MAAKVRFEPLLTIANFERNDQVDCQTRSFRRVETLRNVDHIVGELRFQVLYPPEGSTSVLEVTESGLGPLLHVSLREDGDLTYEFFAKSSLLITEKQFREIDEMARKKLSWTDLSAFGLESFDED
ncbi:hypothetical protein shim_34740 [Shimia sp. SK013]|uniref:hypothetical protein n=1 Tax=Shimia sp. SK013 TaxID=1389006 RepID=UPI0006B67079|nr:hypothetical protein [Shimia sp. SK013]KPA20484.1 hypothetical protein shim_34740 [Shimia sp. SK013]